MDVLLQWILALYISTFIEDSTEFTVTDSVETTTPLGESERYSTEFTVKDSVETTTPLGESERYSTEFTVTDSVETTEPLGETERCSHVTCLKDQFECASRRWRGGCVPLATVCDGRAGDCDDGSDESHCGAARACPPRWLACASGRCVPPAMVCDGSRQCPDGADERQCGERDVVSREVFGDAVRMELPSWLALDQDTHFALPLAPMLRARSPRDKLDAQMAVLRLFRDLARN